MAYISFQPSDHFNPLLWSGTGGSSAKTGVGFAPDLAWIKSRTNTENHCLSDTVRGANKQLRSDVDEAESSGTDDLTAFDGDGFTLGNGGKVNASGQTYVGWSWKAGTTTGIVGSPSITPTSYSFNATSGFSIIEYTGNGVSGATLPHGLNAVPRLMIMKNRDATMDWVSYHQPMGNTKYLVLNSTAAAGTSTTRWNDTTPGATLFTIGDTDKLNSDTVDYIAYVWAPIKGYSSFGQYTGNGNANGSFAYTGFRPAFVMIKRTNHTTDWRMYDNTRLGYNVDNNDLAANTNAAEGTGDEIDLLSNGFKLRIGADAPNPLNGTSASYLYMAFAEFPFVSSNDVAGVAR